MIVRLLNAALILLIPAGCRQESGTVPREATAAPSGSPASPAVPSPPPEASLPSLSEPVAPADVVRRVNQLRRAGRLREMLQYVADDRRSPVLDLVQAVDELLLANRILQDRIKASGGEAIATLFDRSGVANVIDVFSYDVAVLREEVHGDSAAVTIQVGRRLPLSTVRLVRRGNAWLIDPGPPIPGLPDELRKLGKALRRVAQTVEQGPMTTEQIEKEMEFWQTPVLRRIEKLIEQAREGKGEA